MKKIPDYYEDLKWGTTYDEVYKDACDRGETIDKDYTRDMTIWTTRDGYENVKGTVRVMYDLNDNKSLGGVVLIFEKHHNEKGLKKIYDSYKKRLDKYCDNYDKGKQMWKNESNTTCYFLEEHIDYVSFTIIKCENN